MSFNAKKSILFLAVAISMAAVFLLWQSTDEIKKKNAGLLTFENLPSKTTIAKIMFVGDLMVDRGIRFYAEKGGGNDFILQKILLTLKKNDLVLANLEGPITENKSISYNTAPGSKNNYFFTFDKSWAKTLANSNIKIVNLGNNHILNFDYEGLEATKNFLTKEGINYFNPPKGPKSISIKIKKIRITFVGYNQFSELGDVEEKSTLIEIEKAKEFSDVIVVYCHWGEEYLKNPGKTNRELAHKFIDAGADLIVGSHSHIIGEIETYKNKKIYYSLGNFVFDQYFNENVRNGIGIIVKITKKGLSDKPELDFEEKHFYLAGNGQTILKQ